MQSPRFPRSVRYPGLSLRWLFLICVTLFGGPGRADEVIMIRAVSSPSQGALLRLRPDGTREAIDLSMCRFDVSQLDRAILSTGADLLLVAAKLSDKNHYFCRLATGAATPTAHPGSAVSPINGTFPVEARDGNAGAALAWVGDDLTLARIEQGDGAGGTQRTKVSFYDPLPSLASMGDGYLLSQVRPAGWSGFSVNWTDSHKDFDASQLINAGTLQLMAGKSGGNSLLRLTAPRPPLPGSAASIKECEWTYPDGFSEKPALKRLVSLAPNGLGLGVRDRMPSFEQLGAVAVMEGQKNLTLGGIVSVPDTCDGLQEVEFHKRVYSDAAVAWLPPSAPGRGDGPAVLLAAYSDPAKPGRSFVEAGLIQNLKLQSPLRWDATPKATLEVAGKVLRIAAIVEPDSNPTKVHVLVAAIDRSTLNPNDRNNASWHELTRSGSSLLWSPGGTFVPDSGGVLALQTLYQPLFEVGRPAGPILGPQTRSVQLQPGEGRLDGLQFGLLPLRNVVIPNAAPALRATLMARTSDCRNTSAVLLVGPNSETGWQGARRTEIFAPPKWNGTVDLPSLSPMERAWLQFEQKWETKEDCTISIESTNLRYPQATQALVAVQGGGLRNHTLSLVLDRSGSMGQALKLPLWPNEEKGGMQRSAEVLPTRAVQAALSSLYATLGIIPDGNQLVLQLHTFAEDVKAETKISTLDPVGRTNLVGAIKQAATAIQSSTLRRSMVVITDGQHNMVPPANTAGHAAFFAADELEPQRPVGAEALPMGTVSNDIRASQMEEFSVLALGHRAEHPSLNRLVRHSTDGRLASPTYVQNPGLLELDLLHVLWRMYAASMLERKVTDVVATPKEIETSCGGDSNKIPIQLGPADQELYLVAVADRPEVGLQIAVCDGETRLITSPDFRCATEQADRKTPGKFVVCRIEAKQLAKRSLQVRLMGDTKGNPQAVLEAWVRSNIAVTGTFVAANPDSVAPSAGMMPATGRPIALSTRNRPVLVVQVAVQGILRDDATVTAWVRRPSQSLGTVLSMMDTVLSKIGVSWDDAPLNTDDSMAQWLLGVLEKKMQRLPTVIEDKPQWLKTTAPADVLPPLPKMAAYYLELPAEVAGPYEIEVLAEIPAGAGLSRATSRRAIFSTVIEPGLDCRASRIAWTPRDGNRRTLQIAPQDGKTDNPNFLGPARGGDMIFFQSVKNSDSGTSSLVALKTRISPPSGEVNGQYEVVFENLGEGPIWLQTSGGLCEIPENPPEPTMGDGMGMRCCCQLGQASSSADYCWFFAALTPLAVALRRRQRLRMRQTESC